MSDLIFDTATAQAVGRRELQEDALVSHFPQGTDLGFVVLADGMGGHAAGDVASKIVVTEVFSELLFQSGDTDTMARDMGATLRGAAEAANECISAHTAANHDTLGMGSTLLAPVFLDGGMWWISIGDSPLLLFRNGVLSQLNEDHSLAPQIDLMASRGLMDPTLAAHHPDRNTLTSVLIGHRVGRIDCPVEAFPLAAGDVVIVASDGLQFLENSQITEVLADHPDASGAEIATALLRAIAELEDEDQDNISLAVIRVVRSAGADLCSRAAHLIAGAAR